MRGQRVIRAVVGQRQQGFDVQSALHHHPGRPALGLGLGVKWPRQQVVALVELICDRAEVVQTEAEGQGTGDARGYNVRFQGVVEPRLPALIKLEVGLDLVHYLESRHHPRLQRTLAQQRPGESVQRLYRGVLQAPDRFQATPLFLALLMPGRPLLKLQPHLLPQLGRGGVGEGDGGDGLDTRPARLQQRHDARHQCRGLAGARASLHEQVPVERAGDQVACVLVGRNEIAHYSSSSPVPCPASSR